MADTTKPRGTFFPTPAFAAPSTNYGLANVGNYAAPSLVDIDGDGDLDVLIGNQSGDTVVQLNTGSATAPLFGAALTNPYNLANVGNQASPSFVDIDGDGDLDALIGNSAGNTVVQLNTGSATAPAFGAANTNRYGLLDAGDSASPSFVDINGDGRLDALIGNGAGTTVVQLNTSSTAIPAFGLATTNPYGLANVGPSASPSFVDIDGDGDLDALIGNRGGNTLVQLNTGTTVAPAFGGVITNPYGLADVGAYASPSFVDIDGDGDLDALIGSSLGAITVRVNDGNLVAPVTSTTANGSYGVGSVITLNVEFNENVLVNTTGGTPSLRLETGAFDRNATFSSVSGNKLIFTYTVQAGDTSADLTQQSASALALNGGSIKDAAGNNAILTLAAPSAAGSLGANKAIVIDTTAPRGALLPTPAFAAAVFNPFGLTAGANYANASFVDIDGDGDLDAFLGDSSGSPRFFSNTGSASAPAFAAQQVNPFGLTYIDSVDSPSFVDIDGDGDLDGLFGTRGGDIYLTLNTGTTASPAFAPKTLNPFGLTNVGAQFAMPTLVDIDGDGDLDIFTGNRDGDTIVQLNTGTQTAPAFGTAAANPYGLSNVLVIEQANPNFADVDGDGDLDLFIGQVQGNTLYFQNTGTVSAPAFAVPVTNPFGIPQVNGFASASFVDIDNDGDLDVFLGERNGTIRVQLNDGNRVAPVNSTTADGTYRATSTITLTVAFNEVVIVTGNPMLLLETGATDRSATFSGGSGTNTLTFTYNVQAGDTSADLTQQSSTALALNGGTIKDAAGNNAILTLAAPAAVGSLGANKAIVIDTTAPTLDITSNTSTLKIGQTATITFTFSEAPTGFAAGNISVGNGAISSLAVTGDPKVYTAIFTPTANIASGNASITVAASSYTDAAGNNGGAGTAPTISIDTARPTATIAVADTALRVGETSGVTITFSEAVTGFTNADLTLANGTLTAVSSGDGGTTWTATFTPTTNITDTTNVITLDNTGVSDTAGNTGTGTTNSNNYAIDTARPTLASAITVSDTALKVGDTATVGFAFTEAVTGFTPADLTSPSGSLSSLSTADGGISWTATLTPSTNTTAATNVITLNYAGISDLAGNAGTGSATSGNYAVDTAAPTLGITSDKLALKINETATITFAFSEAPTGFAAGDIGVVNGAISGFAVDALDAKVYTAIFTPTANLASGNASITVAASNYTDAAGNNGGAGTTPVITIDTLAPAAPTIAQVAVDDTINIAEATAGVTLSGTGEVGATVTLSLSSGSLLSAGNTALVNGSGAWTRALTNADVAALGQGLETITASQTDAAGNPSAASATRNITVATAAVGAPVINLVAGDDIVNGLEAGSTITGTNVAGSTVALSLGGNIRAATVTGTSWSYTLQAADIAAMGQGPETLSATQTDAASNQSAAGTRAITIDTVAPTLLITSNVDAVKAGETATITFTFSEAPTDFAIGDISALNGGISNLTATANPLVFTAVFTPDANLATGSASITVAASNYTDAAGNNGDAGLTPIITIDTLAPAAPIISLVAGDDVVNSSEVTSTITGTNEAGSTVALSIGGNTRAATVTGTSWSYTLQTADITDMGQGAETLSALQTDAAGNTSTAGTRAIAVDTVSPTVAITSNVAALKSGQTADVTFTFSEAPGTSFTASDITATGGTVSALTVNALDAKIYAATFTPTANLAAGNASITLAASSYTDAAGNNGGAGTTPIITIDTLAPTLAITSSVPSVKIGQTAVLTFTFSEAPGTSFVATDIASVGGAISAFSVTGDVKVYTATFTPTANLTANASVTVAAGSYLDAAGNNGALGATPALAIDTLAPVFLSASASGNQLVLTYTEASTLDAVSAAPANSAFAVTTGSSANAVTAVVVNAAAKTVTLTLTNAISFGQAMTVAYTDPAGDQTGGVIQDAAGNDAITLAATNVVNTTPDPTPPPNNPATSLSAIAPSNGTGLPLQQGDTVSINTSTLADADGLGPLTYQWLRNGVAINGAEAGTYGLSSNDVAATISVAISYTDGRGSPERLVTGTTALIQDNDGIDNAIESQVPALTSSGVKGDGNGDGTQDVLQLNVTSGTAPGTTSYFTLVADSNKGLTDVLDTNQAILSQVKVGAAPVNLPNNLSLNALLSYKTDVGTAGTKETFSVFVDASTNANGYWVKDASGVWNNLATSIEAVGSKLRIDFAITDGSQFDTDGQANGSIDVSGGAGQMQLSIVGQPADVPPAGFWF